MHVHPSKTVVDVVIKYCAGSSSLVDVHIKGFCNSITIESCSNVRVACDGVIEGEPRRCDSESEGGHAGWSDDGQAPGSLLVLSFLFWSCRAWASAWMIQSLDANPTGQLSASLLAEIALPQTRTL